MIRRVAIAAVTSGFLALLVWSFFPPPPAVNSSASPTIATASPSVVAAPAGAGPDTKTGEKSRAERWSVFAAAWRSIVVDATLILLFVIAISIAYWETRRESVVIEPIDTPASMVQRGFTPTVIAQRLVGEINAMKRAARFRGRFEDAVELSISQLDFVVPAAGLSYRTMIRYARRFVGRQELRVRGEILELSDPLFKGTEIVTDSLSLTLRTVDGRRASANGSVSTEREIGNLIQAAALELARIIDPNLVATYWFWTEQQSRAFDHTFAAIKEAIALTPAHEHHRAYVVWGNALTVLRKYDEAEAKYKTALALTPRSTSALNSWGNLHRRRRRLDDAAAMYQAALRCNRHDIYALGNLANISNDRRHYASAGRYARRALRIEPRFAGALSAYGFSQWKRGHLEEAEAAFRRAMDVDPQFVWSYLNLSRLLAAGRRPLDGIAIARSAVALGPSSVDTYTTLGDLLVGQRQFAAADEAYLLAEQADSGAANAYAGRAYALRCRRRYKEAITLGAKAVRQDPYHPGARLGLGDALGSAGRFAEAETCYGDLLRLDPYQAAARSGLGWLYARQGRFREAVDAFEAAVALDGCDFNAWCNLGEAYLKVERVWRARQSFERARAIAPDESRPLVDLGRLFMHMGRRTVAERCFVAAHQMNARDATALNRLTNALIDTGRVDDAANLIEGALLDVGADLGVLVECGHGLRRLGRSDRAMEVYERALKIDAEHPGALTGRAVLSRRLRRFADAKRDLRTVLRRDSRQEWACREMGQILYELHGPRVGDRWFATMAARFQPNGALVREWVGAMASYPWPQGSPDWRESAERRIAAALDLNRRDSALWTFWGQRLLDWNRSDEALEKFSRALAIDKRNADAWAGKAAALKDDERQADAADRRALRLDPINRRAILAIGSRLISRDRPAEAVPLFDRRLHIDAGDGRLLLLKARAQHKAGAKDAALATYDSASTKADREVRRDALIESAAIMMESGRDADAIPRLKEALKHRNAERAQQLLNVIAERSGLPSI